ncbi:MAG: lipoate--protein ligase family protein, partial [Planctomycetaceae bacterium]|nr:lipoate--protein ligase family protein [Planctomycetaceae bacterium]
MTKCHIVLSRPGYRKYCVRLRFEKLRKAFALLYVETENRDAAFHFSVEEYFMRRPNSDESITMIWQTGKCVMLGSFQVPDAEIDMNCARDEGVQIVRRSSGGGTIYTDSGTLLLTMILPCSEGQYPQRAAREMLTGAVVGSLNRMEIPAKPEGRNDITVEGKKISGLAQYVRNGRVCSHCSLLYDMDLDMLTRILRVDDEKITSKAIRSVRNRVTNLKEYMGATQSTQVFWNLLKQKLF